MGQTVLAILKHRLTPEEIVRFPERLLKSTNEKIVGQWSWSVPNIDTNILSIIWNRNVEYFIHNSWSEKDLVLLEKNDLTLHFCNTSLVVFDNSMKWFTYERNEILHNEFNFLAKEMATLLNACDTIIVPEPPDNPDMTPNEYRAKAKENKTPIIELK
jgi:hypothetical protein